ncbi:MULTISPECIES: putative Na+/H+ antiporter [unclassified Duganella]|uniref:putative Na+/H+ antiporter n=1 Tax=unclassified Duganella TaxID=2636909 RepID=UPI00087E8868|nr:MULTISPECIES: putative Na+/H+ antiporter [unclassified Duganella]SDG04819.1 Putative Na+/H+ antiporter [Duganella sp. OV458]SDJ00643.1 Putative Na+/H+ antiporter [Duganella sp. OV510]
MQTIQLVGAVLFGLALLHTFAAKSFEQLSHRYPRHAGLFHLLGEVEVVFGFWAFVLMMALALLNGGQAAIAYAESRQYTEPLFVFVVMVVAASRPVMDIVQRVLSALARLIPVQNELALVWLGLALVPLTGSLITEPAAMTLAALMLAPLIFRDNMPEWLKYAALGVLFVNISIGGMLTSYAAPPVLMVAATWNWDTAYMAAHFGWKAVIAVIINATVISFMLRKHLHAPANADAASAAPAVPLAVTLIHLGFLAAVVVLGHHPVLFLGIFMLFLGFTTAYQRYQSPLIIKEGLLVGFFLAGLVVLGGMQQWWLQPIVESLSPLALFFGAMSLTAITDNAALTYLGSLIDGMSAEAQYMLMAGAVTGGGLTVIANAPNPAGAALLRRGFRDESIGALGLLAGAAAPTAISALAFLLL